MRIAVVGTGISGLAAAYLLHSRHDVTVFEAENRVGGHTHTVDVESGGRRVAVDTGFIVFNERNYPNFVRLLDRLGVRSRPTTMSFSVRCDRTGIEYNGTSLNTLFAQRRNLFRPRFLRMLAEILRFNREATELLQQPETGQTVGEYLEARRHGTDFAETYLIPMGAAIWSAPPGVFRGFPIRFVVEFFDHHRLLSLRGRPVWRVVEGGSARYVEPMTAGFQDRIRTGAPVREVTRSARGVRVKAEGLEAGEFDHVILACHADQALAMLTDATGLERDVLSSFPYQANETTLHTDTSVLPRRRLAWAAWNYRVPASEADRVTVTYDMNILQGLREPDVYCVTLNAGAGVDPARVVRRMTYEHPVYTVRRNGAQARHDELIKANRTSFCGAYWGYGFHEDGLKSGLAVAAAFGESL